MLVVDVDVVVEEVSDALLVVEGIVDDEEVSDVPEDIEVAVVKTILLDRSTENFERQKKLIKTNAITNYT